MPSDPPKDRKESRLDSSAEVLVLVEKSSEITLVGQSVACETVNLSSSGVGLLLDRFVPTNSIIKMTISIVDPPLLRAFDLTGEIRWVKEADEGCHTGIRFQQTGEFDSWKDGFQKHMGAKR